MQASYSPTAGGRRCEESTIRLQYVKREWHEGLEEYVSKYVIVDITSNGERTFSEAEPGDRWHDFRPCIMELSAVDKLLEMKVPCDTNWGVRLVLSKTGDVGTLHIQSSTASTVVRLESNSKTREPRGVAA